ILKFLAANDYDKRDLPFFGIFKLLVEFDSLMIELTADAVFPQDTGQLKGGLAFFFSQVEEENIRAGLHFFRKSIQLFQHIINTVNPKADAYARDAGYAKQTRKVVVAAAAPDAAHLHIERLHFKDGTGVIVQPSGQGKVYLNRQI